MPKGSNESGKRAYLWFRFYGGEIMKCNNCGNEIEDGVGFCRFCGSSTVAPSQPTMERPAGGEYSAVGMEVGGATYQKMPTKKKKNLKWLIPVIAIVVVLGVLAGIFVPKPSSTHSKLWPINSTSRS